MDLFSQNIDLKIAKISGEDVDLMTDNLKHFKNILSKHENMYPGIDKWFKNKVMRGILDGERIAYLGFKNNEPCVSAVVKKGRVAKFCHLHIDKELRDNKLGELFFSMMATDVRNIAKSVFFTLPESLWIERTEFFKSFGFKNAIKSKSQYRKSEEELESSIHFKDLWKNVLIKLPKIITSLTPSNKNIFTGLLMSIKPEYIKKISAGEKIVEIRKRFNRKWQKCRVTLYSSSPSQELCGHAFIDNISKDDSETIWNKYERKIGCTKEEYNKYVNTTDQVFAIELKDFEPYLNPLYLSQISSLINIDLKPPQSYLSIKNHKEWVEAISLAELLHGRFHLYSSII